MTEITDAEAAEVLWASSEQGKAAVEAAREKARQLLVGSKYNMPASMAEIGAILYAAYLAAGWDAEPAEDDEFTENAEPTRCEHKWAVLKAQAVDPPGFVFGKPVPHTAALARCLDCGLPGRGC